MAKLRPFASRLMVAGAGLSVLFTLLSPESSAPLTFLPRLLFWTLHTAIGLGAAVLSARLILALRPHTRDWLVVLLSGVGGVLLFAPLAVGIETLFSLGELDGDNDVMDRLAESSLVLAILVEAIEMAPPYLAAWLLINLEPVRKVFERSGASPGNTGDTTATTKPDSLSEDVTAAMSPEARAFLERLPPAIGTELVSVSSDLHYLNVTTRLGHAMMLGSLQEVEEAFSDQGLRVHRSHWVFLDSVVSLSKTGKGWFLHLVGGQRVAVSRRRRSDVIRQLGEDFVKRDTTASH
ncbi:MAG: LytTR family DNA-binding domain-containing protein [Pseudomonadota bacterium]